MADGLLSGFAHADPLQNSGMEEGRGVDGYNSCPVDEDLFFDWDAFYGTQDTNLKPSDERISWSTIDFLESNDSLPNSLLGLEEVSQEPNVLKQPEGVFSTQVGYDAPKIPGFTDVAECLDGAYRPTTPCDNCRKKRLQCLILRRSAANPNPVPSCSSCVGLFRPCSFSKNGQKRQASGFETHTPVFGHLHGLIEQADEGTDNKTDYKLADPCKSQQKETKQFVRRGARVLRDWFSQNEDCPYPSEEEKARLAQETGFSKQRISTWFANARRRHKQRQQLLSSTRIHRAGSPMPTSGMASMTPMERWQASPPDDEPVSETAIREAIASTSVSTDAFAHHGQIVSHSTDLSSGFEGRSLISSLSSFSGTASDVSDSASSAWSYQSSADGPLRSRQRQRRQSSGRGRGGHRRVAEDSRYQCTFCAQSFKKKHDWSRHEKSVHLPLDVWICTPEPSQLEPTDISFLECRFCEVQYPSQEHWESHDFRGCATLSRSERSFSRKDYLWQHLRKFHGCTRLPVPDLDAWRSSQNELQSRCGFCTSTFSTWTARADHLAMHFKEGSRMSQWVGDWGFDSSVLANLRNAVLPIERGSMEEALI